MENGEKGNEEETSKRRVGKLVMMVGGSDKVIIPYIVRNFYLN